MQEALGSIHVARETETPPAYCNPGRVHGRPLRPSSLRARARATRQARGGRGERGGKDHIRGPVAAAQLPWQQGGWQASHAEGRARSAQEAAQRRHYESGHRGFSLGDGKEARGSGRTGSRQQSAPASRLLPHKS